MVTSKEVYHRPLDPGDCCVFNGITLRAGKRCKVLSVNGPMVSVRLRDGTEDTVHGRELEFRPTAKQIKAETAKIRKGWSRAERRSRIVKHNPPAMTYVVKTKTGRHGVMYTGEGKEYLDGRNFADWAEAETPPQLVRDRRYRNGI